MEGDGRTQSIPETFLEVFSRRHVSENTCRPENNYQTGQFIYFSVEMKPKLTRKSDFDYGL